MRKNHSAPLVGLVFATLLLAPILALAEDFNEARLQAGKIDYQSKKYLEAIDEFRIAAFGYLDRPVLLSECLVRLSLAQLGAGKSAAVDATLARFLEVERRFSAYGKANLEPETRSAFRSLLAQRVPTALLPAASAPAAIPTAKADAPGSRPASAAVNSPSTASQSKEILSESRRLVSTGKPAEAAKELSVALKTDPGNRGLRLALLEAACLTRAYDVAAAQLSFVTPFSDSETSSMFYAAVVLYETGRVQDAREYMKKAAPGVSGPLVDEYSRKILGQP